MVNNNKFQEVINTSASKETSAIPTYWTKNNPTIGHCAIVAVLVQEILGGELLRSSLKGTEFEYGKYHYWNKLSDGSEVDFTNAQFEGRTPSLVGELRDRQEVLSDKKTKQRYNLYKKNFYRVLSSK